MLYACTDSPNPEEAKKITFEHQDIPLDKKIRKALNRDYLKNLGLDAKAVNYLYSYYKSNNYEALWINDSTITDLGSQVKDLLKNQIAIGIPEYRNSYGETSINFQRIF